MDCLAIVLLCVVYVFELVFLYSDEEVSLINVNKFIHLLFQSNILLSLAIVIGTLP